MPNKVMSEDDFHAYINGFNDNKFEEIGRQFWAEDVQVLLGPIASRVVIEGRRAVIDFFASQREGMAERLTAKSLEYGPSHCKLSAAVQFTAKKDFPEGYVSFPPITKGQGYKLDYQITYTFDEAGQISRISAERLSEPEITRPQ